MALLLFIHVNGPADSRGTTDKFKSGQHLGKLVGRSRETAWNSADERDKSVMLSECAGPNLGGNSGSASGFINYCRSVGVGVWDVILQEM